jgi:glycosyltransferase involved in cell wall biosynthesis
VGTLGAAESKCRVNYLGVDESKFFRDNSENPQKSNIVGTPQPVQTSSDKRNFRVLFRGRITREAGAEHVVKAAKILEGKGVDFLIIGFGWGDAMARFDSAMTELKPNNVTYINKLVPIDDLRRMMSGCDVSLGQLSDNVRLTRTIPHKAYESMAMKLPYITARAEGIMEILTDRKNCLLTKPADPEDLADKILLLKNNPELANQLALNAFELFHEKFESKKIVAPILQIINEIR